MGDMLMFQHKPGSKPLKQQHTHTVASAQRGPVPGNPDFQDPSWAAGDGMGAGKMNMKK